MKIKYLVLVLAATALMAAGCNKQATQENSDSMLQDNGSMMHSTNTNDSMMHATSSEDSMMKDKNENNMMHGTSTDSMMSSSTKDGMMQK